MIPHDMPQAVFIRADGSVVLRPIDASTQARPPLLYQVDGVEYWLTAVVPVYREPPPGDAGTTPELWPR